MKDAAMGGGSLPPLALALREHGADVTAVAVGLSWNPKLRTQFASAEWTGPANLSVVVALTSDDLRAAW